MTSLNELDIETFFGTTKDGRGKNIQAAFDVRENPSAEFKSDPEASATSIRRFNQCACARMMKDTCPASLRCTRFPETGYLGCGRDFGMRV
jgi:hypothetical protein